MGLKNKKGWIRIVEAMIAILLIATVALIVLSGNKSTKTDISNRIYVSEQAMLKSIQFNDSARKEVLSVPVAALPVPWAEFSNVLPNTGKIITQISPGSFQCLGQVCATTDPCILQNPPSKTLYAQSAVIAANMQYFNPVLLKVFCW